MSEREKSWRQMVDLAEHYRAIGQVELFLSDRKEMDRPWEYVLDVREGSSVRWNIRTDIHFVAAHPCGLTFEWWIDLEKREQDGNSTFQLDVDRLLNVLEELPDHARPRLRKLLRTTSEALSQHVADQQGWLDRERRQAEALYRLGTSEVPS